VKTFDFHVKENKFKIHGIFTIFLLVLFAGSPTFFLGCGAMIEPQVVEKSKDEFGCSIPHELLTLNPAELKLTNLKLGEFALAQLDVKTNPKVFEAIEKVSSQHFVHDYLLCRSIKQGFVSNFAQQEYLRSKLQFMSTKPTADQYLLWETNNRLPN